MGRPAVAPGGRARHVDLPFGKDQARVADDVGDLAGIGADDRHATGHGLDKHPAELLLPVGARPRGHHQDVQLLVVGRHLAGRDPIVKGDPVGQAQAPRLALQASRFGPTAQHVGPPHALQARQRLQAAGRRPFPPPGGPHSR